MSAGYGLPFEDDKNKDIVEASKQPEAVTDVPSIRVILLSGEELMTTDPSNCTNDIELKRGILEASRERGLDWSPDFLDLMPAEWVDIVRTRQVQAFCNREVFSDKYVSDGGKKLDMSAYEGEDIDDLLKDAAPHLRNLTEIHLEFTKVTDAGVKEAAPFLTNLQVIELACTKVGDTGLKEVAKYCKDLIRIDLYSTKVTDAGLMEAAPHLTNLEELCLSYTRVRNTGMKEIATHCTKLKTIDLDDCRGVHRAGIMELIRKCPSLEKVVTPYHGHGCELEELQKAYPKIDFL